MASRQDTALGSARVRNLADVGLLTTQHVPLPVRSRQLRGCVWGAPTESVWHLRERAGCWQSTPLSWGSQFKAVTGEAAPDLSLKYLGGLRKRNGQKYRDPADGGTAALPPAREGHCRGAGLDQGTWTGHAGGGYASSRVGGCPDACVCPHAFQKIKPCTFLRFLLKSSGVTFTRLFSRTGQQLLQRDILKPQVQAHRPLACGSAARSVTTSPFLGRTHVHEGLGLRRVPGDILPQTPSPRSSFLLRDAPDQHTELRETPLRGLSSSPAGRALAGSRSTLGPGPLEPRAKSRLPGLWWGVCPHSHPAPHQLQQLQRNPTDSVV